MVRGIRTFAVRALHGFGTCGRMFCMSTTGTKYGAPAELGTVPIEAISTLFRRAVFVDKNGLAAL